jgi:hypothetical protein
MARPPNWLENDRAIAPQKSDADGGFLSGPTSRRRAHEGLERVDLTSSIDARPMAVIALPRR